MFIQTYKTSVRNLIRTKTFWLMLIVLAVAVVQKQLPQNSTMYAITYNDYVQAIMNTCCATLLIYPLPIFIIATVSLLLKRDYNDNFFEIEKAANIKPSVYVLGRIAALITVNSVVMFVFHFIAINLYVFGCSGVDGLLGLDYFFDMIVRIIYVDLFVALPTILFYIGISYCIGSIFKSNLVSSVISLGYVLFHFVIYLIYRHSVWQAYFDYLSPIPGKLRDYFHYYNTDLFEWMIEFSDTSPVDVAICILFLMGVCVLGIVISYYCTRKRDI